jgi:ankyrin repeat protein
VNCCDRSTATRRPHHRGVVRHNLGASLSFGCYTSIMFEHKVTCMVLLALCVSAKAHAANFCQDIQTNYDLVKAEVVSVQTNSALFAAADNGCEDLARKLITTGASVLARDRRGAMPLAHAARAGKVSLVSLFLADGAPINARDVDGGTALFAAAEHEKASTVTLLLAKGADPNLSGRSGLTPLIAAAFTGFEQMVHELMTHGADWNARDKTDKTAMTYSAARGFDDVVHLLLDAGVDARARYGNDLTALMWAAGHDKGVSSQASYRVIDLLLAHGANLDDADNRGRTALMIAADLGYADIVDILVHRGADRAKKDHDGKTAFDLASNSAVREKLSAE